jgi:RimJ/RimL family protein N-acetyltransferase
MNLGHIGNITTYVDMLHYVADISILIGEKVVWGQGYGTEAFIAMCNYLFQVVKIRKITAGTLAVNFSMLGVMRKAGMAEDGRRIRHCLLEGFEVDVIRRALFLEDWLKKYPNR